MKEIKNTNGLYFANKNGQIIRNGKVLKEIDNGKNYKCVVLSINGKTKRHYIHRLVCETYLENPENKKEVNHINGIKSDNRLENLEWATRSENQYHRYEVLKHKGVNFGKTGSKNWNSKPVIKMDIEGNNICVYAGVMEAQRKTGINEANIRSVIYGKSNTAGGYKWCYN